MIGTRDLVLFLVTLVFLFTGISFTWESEREAPREVVLEESVIVSGAEAVEATAIDRSSIVARLREAIRTTTFSVTPAPSVTADIANTATGTADSSSGTKPLFCGGDDVIPNISQWPVGGASSDVVEGARIYTAPVKTQSGTSTILVTKTFLSLPVTPAPTGTNCLPSEVVGVTNDGDLLFTSDVASYAGTFSNQLLGMARDGYPIYGSYDGELDECGGYEHPAGYRYSVQSGRESIISCFRATPQPFLWQ